MDEIEASQKIIQLTHEKQKKAQDELQIVHQEKRKLTDKLGEQASKKFTFVLYYCFYCSYLCMHAVKIPFSGIDVSLSERVLLKKDKLKLCAIKEVLFFKSCYPRYMFYCIILNKE